jgi:hypothetical protein
MKAMLKYSDNQWNRRKVAILIRMATKPNSMESLMVGINAHFEAFSAGLKPEDISKTINEFLDRQETILECYKLTDDECDKAKYRAMDVLLGTLRQELKIQLLSKRAKTK